MQKESIGRSSKLVSLVLIMSLLVIGRGGSISPSFLTTIAATYEAGSVVLTSSSLTNGGSFASQNTTLTFLNSYTVAPQFGYGFSFISSLWTQTTATTETIIDITSTASNSNAQILQLNFTSSTVTLFSINYIACASTFFLDVRTFYSDLTSSSIFNAQLTTSQSVTLSLPMKFKSNSSNTASVYTTIGLSMIRNSNTFDYSLQTLGFSSSAISVNLTCAAYNGMRFIRFFIFNYERIVTTITSPYFLDMGFGTNLGGTIPDSSGLSLTTVGTIFMGMADWALSDSYSIISYNMSLSGLVYSLAMNNTVTRTQTAYFWYRLQTCPTYYFNQSNICVSCDYTCLTCFSSTNTSCSSCDSTAFRSYSSSTNSCPCMTNYIDAGVTICQKIQCTSTICVCVVNNVCSYCLPNLRRSLVNGSCVCDPYSRSTVSGCAACDPTCYTCSRTAVSTACLSCSSSKDNRIFNSATNSCDCMSGYYQSPGWTDNYDNYLYIGVPCIACQYTCATCTGSTACLTCNATLFRTMGSSGFCVCMTGYYDNLLQQTCLSCPFSCSTCSSATVCLTCPTTRTLTNNLCPCNTGFYETGIATCSACIYSCLTCTNGSFCTSCNSNAFRTMSNLTCICQNGYYDTFSSQVCNPCSTTCSTCSGANANNCLTCDSTKFRSITLNNTCACMSGYFQTTTNICSPCFYTCQTCTNATSTGCITCNALMNRIVSGTTCICSNKYYDDGGNQLCASCMYFCLTCSSASACLTCDAATRNNSNLSTCPCLTGFYDNGVSTSCQPCLAACLTCTNSLNCTSCPASRTITTLGTCACNARTFEPYCNPCSYSCLSCLTLSTTCTTCNGAAMRFLNTNTSQCVCYQGYYDDGSNQMCATCQYSCLTCSSSLSCLTCPTNRVINGNYCSCLSTQYQNSTNLNCLPCHYSCQTCSSFSQCTACSSANNRVVSGSTTLCVCNSGYYDNGVSQTCLPCSPICLTCSQYSVCVTCNTTASFYFSNGTCLCTTGFYFDVTSSTCKSCHYSCLTCVDSTACTTCQLNRTLTSTYCACDSGLFDNNATQTCTSCVYPCVTCTTTSTTCTSCDSTRTLTLSACLCSGATFDTGLNCSSCMSTCQTCTNSITCATCLTGSLRILSSNLCVCPTGYHDQNGTQLTCVICHYSCATCINSLTCSTCPSGRISVTNGYCICPTNYYYDNGVNPLCVSCHFSCLTCASISTNCTSCLSSTNRVLSNFTCRCNAGFYDDLASANCQPCHYSCQQCTDGSSCTLCNATNLRIYTTGPLCSCTTGFFDVSNVQMCSTCSYTCQTCITSTSFCLTCPSTRTFLNSSSSCPCNNGFYDSGSPTCAACLYSCSTCNNGSACLTCPTTRLLNALLACQCTTGYYDVSGTATCATCASTCYECSSFQLCTLCDTQNTFRQLVNTSCVCPSGYYDASSSSNITCQLCSYSCATCVSATQCSSCSTEFFRVYNISTSKCSCTTGYYDNTVNAPCIPCPYDCLTCSSATVCLTCNSNRYLDGNNRCTCLSSYFANGTLCQSCPAQCATCASSSNCTTCNGNRTLVNFACVCPTAFFAVTGSAVCNACQISCQTCLTASQCSTCNSTKFRYLTSTYCLCMSGYYDNGVNQTCQTCYYSCQRCSNGTTCLTCNSINNRVLNTVTLLCDCISGYYEDSTTKACIQCHFSCLTCTNGSACTSCNTNYNRALNSSTFQCDCQAIGYYDTFISVVCAACDYTCYSCSSSATFCTSCLNSTNRVLSASVCPCSNGFYGVVNQAICLTCSYKCVTCLGSATTCTLCSTANYRSTTPACTCITGYYDDGANATCATCNYVCESCANGLTCSTCNLTVAHRSINNVTLLCDCVANYYDNNISICQSCSYSCQTCTGPTSCTSCPSSRALTLSQCICLQKFYDDYVSLQCQACNYTCQTCQNSSTCFSCNSANFRTFNSSSYICSCMNRYYDVGVEACSACEASCFTCTNATSCASCPPSINKTLNSTTGSNYCVCLYGYYENVTAGVALGYNSVCNPCYYACETCSGQSTYCTLCSNSSNRYLKTNHECACNVGYFQISGQQTCFACFTNCLTCTGVNSNNCLTCDNTTYFLNNTCYTSCPSFYNISTTTRTCASCPSNCLTCVSSLTVCSQCNSPYFIFTASNSSSICVLSCPSYYYQVNNTCYACNSPCLACTAAFTCTSCVDLYYLSNGSCNPCNSLCLTCSGSTALDCITCISDYVLRGSICQKLSCLSTQYVQSVSGCVNCTTTFPNSLNCLSTGPTSCLSGYILSNNSCLTCSAVTGYVYDSTSGKCKDFCGDNIIITDLCDDGNTLNGDGCSSLCTIESGWSCTNNTCTLSSTPTVSVVSITNNPFSHSITILIALSVGLRLSDANFILSFSKSTQFTYRTAPLNIQYTSYQLVVVYFETIQNNYLNIQIKSPASRLLVTSSLALSISLNLSVSIPVVTNPPAIYVSPTTSQVYSRYLFGVLMALHIILIAAVCFFLFKKVKIMLFIIDAFNSVTILYILTALGMYNISLLSYQSSRALQPFIHQFGSKLSDSTTNFYYFNYTSNFFSSTIVQVMVIAATYVLSAYTSKNDQSVTEDNVWYYYRTAFTFAFAIDFFLTSFSTFFWNSYNSYESSYSWMFAILCIIFVISEMIVYYSRMKDSKGQGKKVVPAISFITNDLQIRDKTNQHINIFDGDEENAKEIKSRGILSEWSDEKTQVILGETQQKEAEQVIMYFDITPSVETQYSTRSRTHISAAHLPIISVFFGFLFAIIANIQRPTLRSTLFLVVSILYFVYIVIFKTQTLKSTRNIKLITISLIYIILSIISLVISTSSSNLNTNFDVVIVSFVIFAVLFNIVLFIVSVMKSEAYRDYLINKKNQENMQRNRKQNEARQKIYTKEVIRQPNNKNKTENMISDFPESFQVKQPQIQQTQEHVQEKSFKLSDLKKKPLRPRDQRTMMQERQSSSIINHQIDAEVSDIKESDLHNENFINEKNIFDIKGSYDELSPTKKIKGTRARAINNSQISFVSRKEETPSLLFDSTLERIDEMKGVKRNVNKSNQKEEVNMKKRPKKRKNPKGETDIIENEEYYKEPEDNRKSKLKKFIEEQKRESVDNFLQEFDIPQGIAKSNDSNIRSRMQSISQISSIKEERMEFIEQERDFEYQGSVFNKILQDYKKYSNKKIDRKKLRNTKDRN